MDVCRYVVRLRVFEYRLFIDTDSVVECGARSNVDFFSLYMRTIESQYMFRQHAITILPDPVCAEIRLLCLRYYAVPSVGWSYGSGCAICRDTTRQQIRHLTGCLAPAESCRCNICVRQPPSLKALAFHAHFTLVLNIE